MTPDIYDLRTTHFTTSITLTLYIDLTLLKRQTQKIVKHTQAIRWLLADEFFECV